MLAAAVNKDYGVLATDSETYDADQDKIFYEGLRLFHSPKFLLAYMGRIVYFAKLDKSKLVTDIPTVAIYMKDYLQKMKEEVEEADKPFTLFIIGVHKKLPTIVQFNSYLNFEPKYLFSEGSITKFSTINLGKTDTKEMTAYMETLLKKKEMVSPGVIGEVLSKGIYKKGNGRGMINAAWMKNSGDILPLSGILAA